MKAYFNYLREVRVWRGRIALHIFINMLEGFRLFVMNVLAVNFYIGSLSEGDGQAFLAGLSLFGACNFGLRMISRWYRDYFCEKADIRAEQEIYRKLFERAAKVPYEQYESAAFLTGLEYLAQNARTVYHRVMDHIGRSVGLLSTLFSVTAFLAVMDPWILFVTAAPLLMTKILQKQGKLRHEHEMKKARNERKKAYVWRKFFFYENMDEMRTSDAYGILDSLGRQARENNRQLIGSYGRRLALLGFAADNLGANFAFLAGNLYAVVKMLASDAMPVSSYAVLVVSIASLNSRLSRLGKEAAAFTENLLYIEDFLRFLKEEAIKPDPCGQPPGRVESLRVFIRHFGYPDGMQGLEDIRFALRAGEKLAVVGENGAGKSTLLRVLLGLYRTYKGHLWINEGSAARGMGKSVFALMQDAQIYPGTIAENLLLRECTSGDEKRVWLALQKVQLEEKVRGLQKGIHSGIELFEEGERTSFSTGERQRLALGRMFAGDFDVLFLDEPTAFLDPATEAEIMQEVFAYAQDRMLILVTHRLSAARRADWILYLEKGKVREQGTHDALMKADGMYRKMFMTQRSFYFGKREGERS